MMEGDGLSNGPGHYFSVLVSLLCGFDSLFLFYSLYPLLCIYVIGY